MVRMIDAEKYMELLKEQYLHHKSMGNSQAARAWQGAMQLLYDMPTLTSPNEPRAGLYGKYTVYKNKDGSLVTDCFILRPAKDPAAVAALRAYAAATDNAELAADIINWVGAKPNEPLTSDELRQMDGEPVYVVFMPDSSGKRSQSWALVNVDKKYGEVYLVDSIPGASCYYDEIWADLEGIYRRPPEGEA